MLLPTVIRRSSALCVRPIPVASTSSAAVIAILRIEPETAFRPWPATALSNTRLEVIVVSFGCMGVALSVASRNHFHGLGVSPDDHDLVRRRRRGRRDRYCDRRRYHHNRFAGGRGALDRLGSHRLAGRSVQL